MGNLILFPEKSEFSVLDFAYLKCIRLVLDNFVQIILHKFHKYIQMYFRILKIPFYIKMLPLFISFYNNNSVYKFIHIKYTSCIRIHILIDTNAL